MTTVSARQLTGYLERLYQAAGMTVTSAQTMAEAHVEADLRGIPGHGSRLAAGYLDKLRSGRLNARPRWRAVHNNGDAAVLVVDADRAPGPLAARYAVAAVLTRARRHGIAAVAMRRAGHVGALGVAAGQLAATGLVGICAVQGSAPSVALHGGTGAPVLGSGALALAVPGPDRDHPVLIDLASGAMSWGRLHELARNGQTLPAGMAVDAAGYPTRDPHTVAALLPAGERGQGLAIALELLVGALTGGSPLPVGDDGRGLLVAGFDPRRFGTSAGLCAGVAAVCRAVREQGARMPGDRTWSHREHAHRHGIPLEPDDLVALAEAGRHAGVDFPDGWLTPEPSNATGSPKEQP